MSRGFPVRGTSSLRHVYAIQTDPRTPDEASPKGFRRRPLQAISYSLLIPRALRRKCS